MLAAGSLLLTGVSTASATDDDGGVSATAAALEQAGMFQAAETVSPSSTGGDAAATTARITADHGLAVEGSTGIESTIGVSWADLGSSTRVASADVFASADSSHNVAFVDAANAGPSAVVVMHDPSAPGEYAFQVTADGAPAQLSHAEGGYILVETADGDYVNAIAPAWAKDANGDAVPTSYTIDGATLIQTIDTSGAVFPVVADPQYACDAISCTLEFSRSETLTVKETGWGASAAAAAACALGGPAFAAACLALGAVVTVVATQAYNQGDCLGIRNTGPSPVYPAIYSASESPNCR